MFIVMTVKHICKHRCILVIKVKSVGRDISWIIERN